MARFGRRLTELERRHFRERRALGRKHEREMADVEQRHRGELEDLVNNQLKEEQEDAGGSNARD